MLLPFLLGSLVAATTRGSGRHTQRHQPRVLAHPFSGYPDLLLPINVGSTNATDTLVGDLDGGHIPAVLNYVSPRIRQMNLRRDPTGRDVFLPADALVDDAAGQHSNATTSTALNASLSSPWDPRHVSVFNGRNANLSLDANGFELLQSPLVLSRSSRTATTATVDFSNPHEVASAYYPACEALVRETFASGGGEGRPVLVRAFDHNVRHADAPQNQQEDDDENGEAESGNALPPAGIVHNDYTAASAPRRLEQLASKVAHRNDVFRKDSENAIPAHLVQEALQGRRRYAFVNVWRSIDATHPVQSFPLALMDGQSAAALGDLRLLQIHYVDRVGENYLAAFHKDHRWYYFPEMTTDEAILIKQWDSFGDLCHRRQQTAAAAPTSTLVPSHSPRSTFALHTAFACRPLRHRSSPPPPRKSIEVRCICIWEEKQDECNQ